MLSVGPAREEMKLAIALGRIFSNHVWSTVREAIFWPKMRVSLGR